MATFTFRIFKTYICVQSLSSIVVPISRAPLPLSPASSTCSWELESLRCQDIMPRQSPTKRPEGLVQCTLEHFPFLCIRGTNKKGLKLTYIRLRNSTQGPFQTCDDPCVLNVEVSQTDAGQFPHRAPAVTRCASHFRTPCPLRSQKFSSST